MDHGRRDHELRHLTILAMAASRSQRIARYKAD
jgi:hypothetical protein